MESFRSWLDRPFNPRLVEAGRRKSSPEERPASRRPGVRRGVTIRYEGSFGRSVIKAVIVLALFAVMSNVIGERPGQDLDANQIASTVGAEIGR